MDKNNSNDWQLEVNGSKKPWPVADYMSTPITIDLNWGIDTNVYETTPVTFRLNDLLSGRSVVKGVTVDETKHLVVCSIPIRKKKRQYKVLVDLNQIKTSFDNSLTMVIDGKTYPIEKRLLTLVGEQTKLFPDICYRGEKCKCIVDDEEGTVTITIPVVGSGKQTVEKSGEKNSSTKSLKDKLLDSKYFMLTAFVLGVFVAILFMPRKVVTVDDPTPVPVLEDSVIANVEDDNYSLEAAILYLDSHETWNRDSMERYDDLKGLFDAMNDFRLSTVITDYSGLTASKKFAKLVQVASKKISRGWIPKRGKPDSTQIGDNEISYTYYINWIDQNWEKRNKEDTKKKETQNNKATKAKSDKAKDDRGKIKHMKPIMLDLG